MSIKFVLPTATVLAATFAVYQLFQNPPVSVVKVDTAIGSTRQSEYSQRQQEASEAIEAIKDQDPELHKELKAFTAEVEQLVYDADLSSSDEGLSTTAAQMAAIEHDIKKQYDQLGWDYEKEKAHYKKIITAPATDPEIKRILDSYKKGLNDE